MTWVHGSESVIDGRQIRRAAIVREVFGKARFVG
jgi:hypothetical protein